MELNKIHNVDCLEFMKTLPDKSIDLVVTDPPYGMDYQSSWRTDKFAKIENDISIDWIKPFSKELFRVMKDNSHAYIFCNDYAISEFRKAFEEVGFTPKRTLVWVKNNHTSGDLEGDYGNKTEFVLYLHKGRKPLNGSRDTNVLSYARVPDMQHPTQKPVDLCGFLIKKSSSESEVVFDPFLGSGTTAVAAQMLGRKWIGCEILKEYCEIAEQRINAISNTLF